MASANIPLHCSICPKRPNFSDVSHLLTHIASKGHLSNYYKIKVRSGNDDAARRLVESYDRWYAEWNVEDLMSDRMTQKDKRRSRTRPVARQTPAPKIEAPIPRPARPRAAVGNLLDPRLSEQQLIKLETAVTPTSTPRPGPVLRQRPPRVFGAHMQYWPGTDSRASSRSYTNDYDTSSEYSDPSERHRYHNAVREDSYAIGDDPADIGSADTMAVSESTKLKGVYWPGMDIFDSATPEMRRKRNQKKDSSVVEQLETNSQEVEPTELIFTPTGSFKRQRRISSSVYDDEDDEMIKAESPTPALARPALAALDVNASRRQRRVTLVQQSHVGRGSHEDEHARSDRGNSYGDRAPKRKRRFEVFQDDDVSFGQPAPFHTLTAGFHHQLSPTPAPTVSPYKNYNRHPFQLEHRTENKENMPPVFHHASAYENHHAHQPAAFHYQAFTYGLTQEHPAVQYHNQLYMPMHGYHPSQDDDDNRTLTAPPSPSTA
ncbi:uncharacterized protein N0V89_012251 [Didymosphaeria variabile]|uniref:Uncharacterized protein n=1 Tax=Didymosphaeria variabile TaxID=1932322 RepID=A0A9W8X923_9PLEO|nr:uncharacterized protein N0V89_012251 [Didymosphaeria variabile]KAJ4344508.1 hypothetical protein N0V89_012251 [Didymosphaeria variabile]